MLRCALAGLVVAALAASAGALAQTDDDTPEYKKTLIVEPEDAGKPVVTIFTDDRSIKDISDEMEARTPSRSNTYDIAPPKVEPLLGRMEAAAMPASAPAPSTTTASTGLADILDGGDETQYGPWIVFIVLVVLFAVGVGVLAVRQSKKGAETPSN